MRDSGVVADEVRIDLVGVQLDLSGESRYDHVRGVG